MRFRFVISAVASFSILAPIARAHGDLHDAITGIAQEIAKTPGDATLFLRRAELHRLHADFPEAEADYAAANQLSPDLADVQLGLANLRFAQGQDKAALPLLDDFLTTLPQHPGGRVLRAEILEKYGDWKKADADLAIAVASSPEPHYASKRAQLLARHGQIDTALRCLDEASQAHGRVPVLEQQALDLEERAGSAESALRRLDHLVAREPRSDLWLARKAKLLASLGRTEEAATTWRQAALAFEKLPPEKRNLDLNRALAAEIDAHLPQQTPP